MKFEKRTPQLRLKLEGWRSRFVLVLVVAGFVVLAGRAFYLQAMHTDFLQAKGEARYGRVIDMPASRGPVMDRNGKPLAISTPVESIWATPDDLDDVDDAQVRALARALGMPAGRDSPEDCQKGSPVRLPQAPDFARAGGESDGAGHPGVFQQREFRRYYPAGEVMAHVVGFTGIEDNGQEGIELAADARLAGSPGSRKVIKDRKGRIVEDVESVRAPRDGEAVTLAIDERLQFLAHRELKAAVEQPMRKRRLARDPRRAHRRESWRS